MNPNFKGGDEEYEEEMDESSDEEAAKPDVRYSTSILTIFTEPRCRNLNEYELLTRKKH